MSEDAQRVSAGGSPDAWFTPGRFAAILAVLLVATFPGVIIGTHSFFFRDYGTLGYPFIHFHRESFWRGEVPFWNPLSHCGTPFLAQWNTVALYPFSLLYLLFPLPWSLTYFCLAHLFWGGLGAYWLARRWVKNDFAAAVAGVAFLFSGTMLSSHIYPNYLVTLGWMPWTVWLTERAWQEGGRLVIVAALAGAMQMLSGAPEIILETWLLLLVLWGTEVTTVVRSKQPSAARAESKNPLSAAATGHSRLWRFPLVILLVAGLTAVQLLPFCDLLARSQRGSNYATQLWTMPGWGWANFLAPLFHCFRTPQGVLVQVGQAFLVSYYLGIGVLALALLGGWRARERRAVVLAALALLSLVLALGEDGYLYGWLRRALPFLGVMRFPIKFVYLAAFAAPLLAAFAIQALPAARPESRMPVRLAAVGLLALLGGVAWFAQRYPFPGEDWRTTCHSAWTRAVFLLAILGTFQWRDRWPGQRFPWLLRASLLLLIWLDVQTHTPHLTPVIASSAYAPGVIELKPAPQPGVARVMITPRAELLLMTRTLASFVSDFMGSRLALWSNLNVLEGIAKVSGAATLQLREEAQVEARLYASTTVEYSHLTAFLGAACVSAPNNPVEWLARADYMPMATVGQQPVFAGDDEAFEVLFSGTFSPRERVWLPTDARPFLKAARAADAKVKVLRFQANQVQLEVESPTPAILVIAQTFHPGWRVSVDGRATRLWRANYAFQALEVPAGQHQVRLAYVEKQFWLGLALSGLTAALAAGAWVRLRSGPKGSASAEPQVATAST